MYLVSVGELEPGQVVAKAVTNASGAVLCPPGLELTQAIIDRLVNAGIDHVAIEGGATDVARVQERIDSLNTRFSGVTDSLLIKLKEAMETRLRTLITDSDAKAAE